MSKEEFEANYINLSGITQEFYDNNFVTMPCNCGDDACEGFACVSNNELSIKAHLDLYT